MTSETVEGKEREGERWPVGFLVLDILLPHPLQPLRFEQVLQPKQHGTGAVAVLRFGEPLLLESWWKQLNGAVDRGDERMKGRGGAVGRSGDEDSRWRGRVVLREQKMEAEDERRVETCRGKGK